MNRFLAAVEARIAEERQTRLYTPGRELPQCSQQEAYLNSLAASDKGQLSPGVRRLGTEANALHAEGLTWRTIALRLGITVSWAKQVSRKVRQADEEAKRDE